MYIHTLSSDIELTPTAAYQGAISFFLHLAEKASDHGSFSLCSILPIYGGTAPVNPSVNSLASFSPIGSGREKRRTARTMLVVGLNTVKAACHPIFTLQTHSLITLFDKMSRIKETPGWKAEGGVIQLFPTS